MTKTMFTRRYERFLTELVKSRKLADASQVTVARKMGRPQSFVSKIETGERRIDFIELIDYCRALSANPKDLLIKLYEACEP